jgi:hypothetical protein
MIDHIRSAGMAFWWEEPLIDENARDRLWMI